ncbi:MAG: hypothetical protein OEX04_05335 [Acidimicrobiia bacterium]|nr:hypothetical protein [Acidimicrobiia bacterium]MDH4306882.1 hypothetical protein [Acidimicrobiia bacterium]
MRAFASYLAAVATLAMFVMVGGASFGQATSQAGIRIPADSDAFASLTQLNTVLASDPAMVAFTGCEVPRADATCGPLSFRGVDPVPIDPRLLVPETVESVEDWRPLVASFFEPGDVDRALQIIACESGGNPIAQNPVSTARGLFQHLGSEWDRRTELSGWFGADIDDPVANVAVGAWLVYEGGGWSHWNASSHCW